MEQWKQIVLDGVEYNYEVSTKDGKVRNMKTGRILNGSVAHGYVQVGLCRNGEQKLFLVHRLVATAFIPNPDNLPEVDHIDRNPLNNSVENLRWVSHQENTENRDSTKRVYCVELDRIFDTIKQAEVETGIFHGNISSVCLGKRKTAGGFHWYFVEEK